MNAIALAWGILAVIGMVLSFVPCVGRLGWFDLPVAVFGAMFGLFAIVKRPEGARNAVIGTALCMLASIVGLIRLVMMSNSDSM